MPYYCKVIKDTIGPNNKRLTTIEVSYPRIIHQEMLRHRCFARNSASSRAIPWKKYKKDGSLDPKCMYSLIKNDPFFPEFLGLEQKGMQSGDEINEISKELSKLILDDLLDFCLKSADRLAMLGIHKSICNRYTEPFMFITELISGTDWNNFFGLRCHPDAEKHIQKIAYLIKEEIEKSEPQEVNKNYWHLPYISFEDLEELKSEYDDYIYHAKMISAGRCARLSYLTHDGKRDLKEDIKLAERLILSGHWSPFEHICQSSEDINLRSGPFIGWKQFRKEFKNENLDSLSL